MYRFTQNWFNNKKKQIWSKLFDEFNFQYCLELGSFEGRSATFILEQGVTELHCVDKWSFSKSEKNFDYNVKDFDNIIKHKCFTSTFLTENFNKYKSYFDLIYIDAAHDARSVLFDAVLSYHLLKKHGILIFDDYNSEIHPGVKIGADSFCDTFSDTIKIYDTQYQLYIQKTKW